MIEEIIEKLTLLLQGRIPEQIEKSDDSYRRISDLLNQIFTFMQEVHEFIIPLSEGKFDEIRLPSRNNFLGSPFKSFHSHLCHLLWQIQQVARGDYSQRVDFMGEFSDAFNTMIIALDHQEKSLKKKIDELETALTHIRKLEGILPICANCKKIRLADAKPYDQNSWMEIERYISKRTDATFSHSICPECAKKLYPDLI